MGRSSRAVAVGLLAICGCGPLVPVDDADGTGTGSTSREPEGEEEGTGRTTSLTDPSTSSTSLPPSTTRPATDVTDDSGGDSSSSSGAVVTCEDLELESVACLTIDLTELVLYGLDSGASCEYGTIDTDLYASSLVWRDDTIVACVDGQKELWYVDLAAGSLLATDIDCDGVGLHPDGILVKYPLQGEPIRLFASFDAILADEDIGSFTVEPTGSRLAVAGDILYSARHGGHDIEMWSLSRGTHVEDLQLDDLYVFDGISIVGDVLYVLATDELIVGLDIDTGERVYEQPLTGLGAPQGLACR